MINTLANANGLNNKFELKLYEKYQTMMSKQLTKQIDDSDSHSSCEDFEHNTHPYQNMKKISIANFSVKDESKADELLQKEIIKVKV